jgi:hypothetical protein
VRLASLAIVSCGLACASSSALRESAGAWQLVTTPNFVVYADLPPAWAVEAAQALEDARDGLITAAWPRLDFEDLEPTEVYVLATPTEFRTTFGHRVLGTIHQASTFQVFLGGAVGDWDWRPDERFAPTSILRHELAHQLSATVYRRQPRWFAEGLAMFLETAVIAADGTTVEMGAPNRQGLTRYRANPSLDLRQMLDQERLPGVTSAEFGKFYGLSWLFVHWLYNSKPEAFTRFQHELARGTSPAQAWSDAFPDFDAQAAARELSAYSQHGVYAVRTFPLRRGPRAFSAVALGPAERHVCRAVVASSASLHDPARRPALLAEARAHALAARALDAGNVRALTLTLEGDPLDLPTRAARAVGAHPDDVRAHLLLARAHHAAQKNGAAAEAALRRAVALAPRDPHALNGLAWLLVETGRSAEAMGFALRAVKRAPWNAGVIDTFARALFLTGSCEQALDLQRRVTVIDIPANETPASSGAERRRHLEEYEAACGGLPAR